MRDVDEWRTIGEGEIDCSRGAGEIGPGGYLRIGVGGVGDVEAKYREVIRGGKAEEIIVCLHQRLNLGSKGLGEGNWVDARKL